jgi:predicted phosphoribosyltransferase
MVRNVIFKLLNKKFQFKFRNRIAAAELLGEALKNRVSEKERKRTVIIGIPRGGVVTADIVSKKLISPFFDIIIPRKLTSPNNKEQAIGAIMEDGTSFINYQLISSLQISSKYLEIEMTEQIKEIKRKSALYRRSQRNDLTTVVKDRTVILIDDGAATGATIIAASRWMRFLEGQPRRFIIAIPIAPQNTIDILEKICMAEVEVIFNPQSSFHSVEQYHQNFDPVSDEKVISILDQRNQLPLYKG